MNQIILIGNITRDLDLRKTQTNKSVVEFGIAVNEGYGDKKTTDFFNIIAWEGLAENVCKYCGKGSKVAVVGKLKTDIYTKDNAKFYKTYILASNIEFINTKKRSNVELTSDGGLIETSKINQNNIEWAKEIKSNSTKLDFKDNNLPFY